MKEYIELILLSYICIETYTSVNVFLTHGTHGAYGADSFFFFSPLTAFFCSIPNIL